MTTEQSSILLQQLGGVNHLQAMIGAHTFLRHETECALSFKFKAGYRFNYVKIWLNDLDLYDLEFGKIRGMSYNVVHTARNVYAEDLVTLFESVTGLTLSLKKEDIV